MTKKYSPLFLVILLFLAGCEGFFGTKTSTEFLDEPVFEDQTVAYVPIQPVIDDLSRPVDIIAGWDELIYVADEGTNEIISFDQAGNELGRFSIPGLGAIAQDRRLDLLAAGTVDTTISGTNFTLPAIYRIDLNKGGPYGLDNASIKTILIHPFYFKSSTPTTSDEQVQFHGIAPVGNNKYYVSRSGPSNNPNQFGGPDNAVLLFDEDDVLETPVFVNTNLGLFRNYFQEPFGITTFAQPPQSPAVSLRGDFIFTSLSEQSVLKVQGIRLAESAFGASFEVINFAIGDSNQADRFLYEPDRFASPVDVTIAGDGTRYIFVVDAEKDSLFQFNALGYEGANPPPGSRSNKAVLASFGGTGIGLKEFNEPRGVAYLDRIVYVADAGNGRILRFQLTTDFE
ncbi:MAG: hypothetical protein AAF206_17800 [Bacteroidota bacterium]